MAVSVERFNQLVGTMSGLRHDRLPHWTLWRELADYYLPRRYVWLQSDKERRVRNARNPFILDGTGTMAARTLASGMMNGITSPARPWFRLRVEGFEHETSNPVNRWLDEVSRRIMLVMAESNFYNALAVMYLDLVIFGTAAMLIYEDEDNIINCFNPALGEYYLAQDPKLKVSTFGREFSYKVHQVVREFGLENCSAQVQDMWRRNDASRYHDIPITHLILPNDGDVAKRFSHVEFYWETGANDGKVLRKRGFNELPGIFPRWEVTANDSYGMSPAMEALGDVIQLQQETKRKGQGLDKMVSPPILADIQMQHRPTALMPNGITFVQNLRDGNPGAKPVYTVNLPLDALTMDIRDVQARIREIFHNDLFMMISQLDTVRSATEIDARREEKLVLLGSVLERFEHEALDPGINRIFNILARNDLLPEAPPELADLDVQVQYMSILSSAQQAVAAIPTERWLTMIANVSPVYPKAVNLPDWDEMLRDYGRDIGLSARHIRPPEEVQQLNQQQDEIDAAREAASTGKEFTDAAQQLSETEVGGGANALQKMLGG